MNRRKKIFLSYRRGDTAGHTGRLHEDLVRVFGSERVFFDVEGLHPGDDFDAVLRQRLAESLIVLVAIGPRWMGILEGGKRRIDEPDDYVRLEVATALADDKTRVIPVLCEGAALPTAAALPDNMASLVSRQAFALSDQRWRHDVEQLFAAITPYVPVKDRAKRLAIRYTTRAVAALLLLGATAFGGLYVFKRAQVAWNGLLASDSRAAGGDANRRNDRSATRNERPSDASIPTAPARRVLPARAVTLAAEQLSRARREWADDAVMTSIEVSCNNSRLLDCPIKLRLSSASRVSNLEATRVAPDSTWRYRQNDGVERSPALSLEIAEFERVVATARNEGVTSDFDRITLQSISLQNGTPAPRWTLYPRNREQAGREGRICIEPQSAARVDCRTGR